MAGGTINSIHAWYSNAVKKFDYLRTVVSQEPGEVLQVELAVSGDVVNVFDAATIASSATSTIATYTVPNSKEFRLSLIEFTGDNIATYFVEIDSVKEAQRRIWFGGSLSGEFIFDKLLVDENIVIRLRVENFRPTSGEFEGRILGVLDDK